MKNVTLVACALAVALVVGSPSYAQEAAGQAALGNAAGPVDERTLAIGDTPEAQAGGIGTSGPSTLAYFLRMLLVLALVLAAMYLVLRFVRGLSRPKEEEAGAIRVLTSASLGTGKALHVVSLGEKAWLVGATEASVSLLAELDDKELLDGLRLEADTKAPPKRKDFSALLGDMLARGKAAPRRGSFGAGSGRAGGGFSLPGSADFYERQKERLRRFKEEGK